MNASDTLVVGTRGSQLARSQTQWVVDRITAAHPGLEVRIEIITTLEIITTRGDRQQGRPLPEIGGKGLFTEELEAALVAGNIDLAVHSAKDLPTELRSELDILAYPLREDARDAWISPAHPRFHDLPPGSVVGTSSLRRQAQLLKVRPDLTFIALRGNVDTRIAKVARGDCHGAVLAMAGLRRVDMVEHVSQIFEPWMMLPAPGQGALALEGRRDDDRVRGWLAQIHDEATEVAVRCERAVLDALEAGCRAPVAAFARVSDQELRCDVLVLDPSGSRSVQASQTGSPDQPEALAVDLVDDLSRRGARKLIAQARGEVQ
jgi:hydroxymethylbilane synthase